MQIKCFFFQQIDKSPPLHSRTSPVAAAEALGSKVCGAFSLSLSRVKRLAPVHRMLFAECV